MFSGKQNKIFLLVLRKVQRCLSIYIKKKMPVSSKLPRGDLYLLVTTNLQRAKKNKNSDQLVKEYLTTTVICQLP